MKRLDRSRESRAWRWLQRSPFFVVGAILILSAVALAVSWSLLLTPAGEHLARAIGLSAPRAASAGPIGDWIGGSLGPLLSTVAILVTAYLAVIHAPYQAERDRRDAVAWAEASKVASWVVIAETGGDAGEKELRRGLLISNRSDQSVTDFRAKLFEVDLAARQTNPEIRSGMPLATQLHFVPPGEHFMWLEQANDQSWAWGSLTPVSDGDGVQTILLEQERWHLYPDSAFSPGDETWGVHSLAFFLGQNDGRPFEWQRDHLANLTRVPEGYAAEVQRFEAEWQRSEQDTRALGERRRQSSAAVRELMSELVKTLSESIERGRLHGHIEAVRQSNMGPVAGGQAIELTDIDGGEYWFAGNSKNVVPAQFSYGKDGSISSRNSIRHFRGSPYPQQLDVWLSYSPSSSESSDPQRRRVENITAAIEKVLLDHRNQRAEADRKS